MDKSSLDKAVNYFSEQLKVLHIGGNANVTIEEVKCDVYNSKMKIKELGTVNSLGGGTYVINLWDQSIAESVKTAIMNTLNLNASFDSGVLKLNFPAATQEKRQEFAKLVGKYGEECMIVLRNIRRDMMSDIDKEFKEKLISEDEKRTQAAKVDVLIKEYSKKVDEIKEAKIKDINTI